MGRASTSDSRSHGVCAACEGYPRRRKFGVIENGVSGILAAAPTIASVREALEVLWTRRGDLRDMGKAAAKAIRQKVPSDPIDVFARKIKCLIG